MISTLNDSKGRVISDPHMSKKDKKHSKQRSSQYWTLIVKIKLDETRDWYMKQDLESYLIYPT